MFPGICLALGDDSHTGRHVRLVKGKKVARWTGLEPATPGVTGRYSNQLSYHRAWRAG